MNDFSDFMKSQLNHIDGSQQDHILHHGRAKKGTQTIHAFGGKRIKDDTKKRLDEADMQAAATNVRFSHEEVFSKIRSQTEENFI